MQWQVTFTVLIILVLFSNFQCHRELGRSTILNAGLKLAEISPDVNIGAISVVVNDENSTSDELLQLEHAALEHSTHHGLYFNVVLMKYLKLTLNLTSELSTTTLFVILNPDDIQEILSVVSTKELSTSTWFLPELGTRQVQLFDNLPNIHYNSNIFLLSCPEQDCQGILEINEVYRIDPHRTVIINKVTELNLTASVQNQQVPFIWKRRSNLMGLKLLSVFVISYPFVLLDADNTTLFGIMSDVMKAIVKECNISMTYIPTADGEFGILKPDGVRLWFLSFAYLNFVITDKEPSKKVMISEYLVTFL